MAYFIGYLVSKLLFRAHIGCLCFILLLVINIVIPLFSISSYHYVFKFRFIFVYEANNPCLDVSTCFNTHNL